MYLPQSANPYNCHEEKTNQYDYQNESPTPAQNAHKWTSKPTASLYGLRPESQFEACAHGPYCLSREKKQPRQGNH